MHHGQIMAMYSWAQYGPLRNYFLSQAKNQQTQLEVFNVEEGRAELKGEGKNKAKERGGEQKWGREEHKK